MEIKGDKIVMDKDEYVVNFLAMGLAMNILKSESKSGITANQWSEFLGYKSRQHLEILKRERPQEIERMIQISVTS
ncbi:MAG: hypothetical protein QNJ51_27535 [Calothrix sp. MO_167.B12]|nr:hypothetical protein [Calothrix sp. MO_167.B12]